MELSDDHPSRGCGAVYRRAAAARTAASGLWPRGARSVTGPLSSLISTTNDIAAELDHSVGGELNITARRTVTTSPSKSHESERRIHSGDGVYDREHTAQAR